MKKVLLFTSVLLMILLMSCSNSEDVPQVQDIILDAENLGDVVNAYSSQKITVSNLADGEFIEIIPLNGSRSTSRGKSDKLLETDINTLIPMRDEDGKIEFYGSDLGIEGKAYGQFKAMRLKKGDSLEIKTYSDEPSYSIDDKVVYYEKFMKYDLKDVDIEDKKAMFISDNGGGTTGDYVSHSSDFGIIDKKGWNNRHTSGSGILDLSGYNHVDLYAGCSLEALRNHTISEFKAKYGDRMPSHTIRLTPITELEPNQRIAKPTGEMGLLIKATPTTSDKEYCIVFEGGPNEARQFVDVSKAKYVDGKYRGIFIPYKCADGKVYIYIGEVTADFFFQYFMDNPIELIEFPNEDKTNYPTLSNPIDLSTFKKQIIPTDSHNIFGARIDDNLKEKKDIEIRFFSDPDCQNEITNRALMTSFKIAFDNPYSFGNRSVTGNSESKIISEKGYFRDMYILNNTDQIVYVKINICGLALEKKSNGKVIRKDEDFGGGDAQFKVYVLSDGERVTDYTYEVTDSIGTCEKDKDDGGLILQATESGDATITITYGGKTASFRWHRG